MAAPTPNVATPSDFLELPVGGTYQFDGSGSTPGVSYAWTLVEKPPEATTAQLTNANTATPTLTGITARGTYIVFLKVTNSFGSSHAYPYPTQATTAPYGFTTPLATAFGVLRIAEAGSDALNPIFKPGRGEYGWFEKGLWPLVKKVSEGLTFPYYDIPTRELTANSIVADPSVTPFTNAVSIDGLTIRNDDVQSEHEVASSYDKINVLSNMVVTGKDLTVSGGTLRVDNIADASGGDVTINANGALNLVPTNGLAVNTTTVNLTADYGATLEMVGGLSETLAVTSNGNLQLRGTNAVQIQAQGDGTISLTANNGLISTYGPSVAVEADVDIDLRVGSTAVTIVNGDVTLTASDDITLTTSGTTGDIALTTSGSNADIVIAATGSDGDISLAAAGATGGISLLAGGGGVGIATVTAGANVSLTAAGTGGIITLAPAVSTNTTKPVFAPGFSYTDTYIASGTGKPAMPEVSFSRHAAGSDMLVDMLVRCSLPKPNVAQLRIRHNIKDTEVILATFSTDASEGVDDLYLRVRCTTRKVTATKLVTHIICDTSDANTFELLATRHVFTTRTLTSDENLYPLRFNFDWVGDSLTDMDCCITARLTNGHDQDVL